MAGGAMMAVPRPRKPQRMLMLRALGAKAMRRERSERRERPRRSCSLRPKRSAVLLKKSMNEPLASLNT